MDDGKSFVVVKTTDGEKKIEVDEDGFIANTQDWCEQFVYAVAGDEGISAVTEEHWKVIKYLRNYYQQYGSCPPIRMLLKGVGLDMKQLYQLFPTGPAKGACRMAGAPKPTGCV